MSPRSKEFYDRARERLKGANKIFEQGEYAIAVGAADYDALIVEREQAERAVDAAERFVAAIDEVLER